MSEENRIAKKLLQKPYLSDEEYWSTPLEKIYEKHCELTDVDVESEQKMLHGGEREQRAYQACLIADGVVLFPFPSGESIVPANATFESKDASGRLLPRNVLMRAKAIQREIRSLRSER